ncbi:MAG: hypothetical protein KDA84_18085, partial [Planctomycetaceae bacterium]|nr:hypothetical protein [Planctomycetaceae bacterium]
MMGREIAIATLGAGIPVTLCERNLSLGTEAIRQIRTEIESSTLQGPHFISGRNCPPMTLASGYEELADADLIIEAVFEDEDLKTSLFANLEPHLSAEAILASNSSSIPITRLAGGLKNPRRMCGLHFCHPVSERPLVEVIRTEKTAVETVNRVSQFIQRLNLFPVLLEDRPGFLLNRLLVPYLNEALELLLEGVSAQTLRQAALDFGMPMSPMHHLDEFGIDVALGVGKTLYRAFPERIVPSELLIAMYKAGWRGRKSRGGFYASTHDNPSTELRAEVVKLIQDRQRILTPHSEEDISLRLFAPLLLEAMRALEESIVEDPTVIDDVLQNGLGMTSHFQGLWTWANAIGPGPILRWLESQREL